MICPKCGFDCKDVNFCPSCGTDLRAHSSTQQIPELSEPYYVEIAGQQVDVHKIMRTYGTGIRKIGAYSYLQSTCKISSQEAKSILDPLYEYHKGTKVSFADGFTAQAAAMSEARCAEKAADQARIDAVKASGKVYCPKCYSTEVTAQKKGFGFVRGALGASIGLDVGLIAGGIGSNKIQLTCLKCGYQWKPGKE